MPYWEPGTEYGYGDIVEYEGHRYKIIQPHRSQGDWAPPVTPALWGRLDDHDHGFGSGEGYRPPQHHQENPPQFGYGQDDKPQQPAYQPHPDQTVEVHHEEKKTSWFDLDDKRKEELEIGGGLLAAAAVIGGGYFAYKQHGKNEEQKKALQWALQNWMDDAQRCTREFYERGPRAPTTWVLTKDHQIPQGALAGGHDGEGNVLFIARAFHEGGVQLGHASAGTRKGAVLSFGGDDVEVNVYEVLLGDERAVHWEHVRGRFDPRSLYNPPVEGGKEDEGTPLAIARARHHEWLIPGKASTKLDGACFAYKGKEKGEEEYEVLCYNKSAGY